MSDDKSQLLSQYRYVIHSTTVWFKLTPKSCLQQLMNN